MPTAAETRPWHAQQTGPYAAGSTFGGKSTIVRAGRWPLSRLAGTRARTLAALVYAASESTPPHPHAELAPG